MCEDNQVEADINGYCLFWNIFLLDLRLSNLSIDIKTLQEYYIGQSIKKLSVDSSVENLSKKFREFIRNYSFFIHNMVSPKSEFYSPD